MSIESWKAEFYPIPADECPKEQAIDHSLQKWKGLLPENLERHDLVARAGELHEKDSVTDDYFGINGLTCSLCHWYFRFGAREGYGCMSCPLFKVRGHECDKIRLDEQISPYRAFRTENNPRPMIEWLEKTKAENV